VSHTVILAANSRQLHTVSDSGCCSSTADAGSACSTADCSVRGLVHADAGLLAAGGLHGRGGEPGWGRMSASGGLLVL
jgi:hypothetical protein